MSTPSDMLWLDFEPADGSYPPEATRYEVTTNMIEQRNPDLSDSAAWTRARRVRALVLFDASLDKAVLL